MSECNEKRTQKPSTIWLFQKKISGSFSKLKWITQKEYANRQEKMYIHNSSQAFSVLASVEPLEYYLNRQWPAMHVYCSLEWPYSKRSSRMNDNTHRMAIINTTIIHNLRLACRQNQFQAKNV